MFLSASIRPCLYGSWIPQRLLWFENHRTMCCCFTSRLMTCPIVKGPKPHRANPLNHWGQRCLAGPCNNRKTIPPPLFNPCCVDLLKFC